MTFAHKTTMKQCCEVVCQWIHVRATT